MQVSYKVKARFLFVLPGFIFLLTVLGYPLGTLVYNSFFRYNFAGIAGRTYIGLENYQKLFTDERFLTTLWNTFVEVLFPGWTAAMIDPKESKVVGKWAYAPIPGTSHVASGGHAWAVNGYSKKKKEAMQFAYWATSKDVQMDLAPAGATLSRASVMTDPGLNAKYPHLAVLGESAKRAQPPMKIAPYSELLDVITQGLSEALSGGKPVGEALKKVNDQWAEILKNNGYIK